MIDTISEIKCDSCRGRPAARGHHQMSE